MIKGIDISVWQGVVDFSKVKASGRDFVIIKATEGNGLVDKQLTVSKVAARKAGLLIGYYCFTRPDLGNTVEGEVEYLLNAIGDLQEGEIIFLDYEVSYAKPVAWCKSWLDYLAKRLNGYKGLVYLNQSLLNSNDWTPLISASYGLWLAKYDYVVPQNMPETKWGTCAFQQYSNREVVSGVSGAVDANVFFGDGGMYKRYGYKVVEAPPATPLPSEQIIADLEKQVDRLSNNVIALTGEKSAIQKSFDEYKELTVPQIQSRDTLIGSLQKVNAENTAQLTLLDGRVAVAINEKNIAVEAAGKLTKENEVLMGQTISLQKDVDRLNEKLKKNLKGYKKIELIKAYFGSYPEKY